MWKAKDNNFTMDSPNVAISGAHLKPAVVVMTGMKVDPTAIDYLVESKTPLKNGTYNNLTFFVDGAKFYGCQFGPIHSWCPE